MLPLATIMQVVEVALQRIARFLRDELASFVWLALLLAVIWLLAGMGLRGHRLALWWAVPAFGAVALICLLGPDRLFPKKPFEGPSLIVVFENHALTLLDLPAFAAAGVAGVLALWLLRARWHDRVRTRKRASWRLAPR